MIRITVSIIWILISAAVLFAQQEPQYTHFIYNKIGINPGYAGVNEGMLTLLHRSQWLGLEGAPQTQLLSVHGAVGKNNVGLGLNIKHHTIGITERWTSDGIYSYRLKAGDVNVRLGLQASIRYYGMDFTDDRLSATDGLTFDPDIPEGMEQRWVPNFGGGIYIDHPGFYLGLSAPYLLETNIDLADEVEVEGRQEQHFYLMTGTNIPINYRWSFIPQVLFKYIDAGPLDADINCSFALKERLLMGITYRLGGLRQAWGESLDLLFATQVSPRWRFGAAYDINLAPIKETHDGSLEAFIQFDFGTNLNEDIINPRFF